MNSAMVSGAIIWSTACSTVFPPSKAYFVDDYEGLFKKANNQAVFLDELDKAPKEIRYALLRYLETGEIEAIGEKESQKVKVYVVAACQDETKIESDIFDRFNDHSESVISTLTVSPPANGQAFLLFLYGYYRENYG